MSIADIVANIDARLTELADEAQRLSDVRDTLRGASPTPRARKPARKPQRASTSKPEAKVAPLSAIMELVKAEPGLNTTTLAKRLEADQSQVLGLLKEAEAGGEVRRAGQRRATSWTWVDQVAERAAEIEAQQKAAKRSEASRKAAATRKAKEDSKNGSEPEMAQA